MDQAQQLHEFLEVGAQLLPLSVPLVSRVPADQGGLTASPKCKSSTALPLPKVVREYPMPGSRQTHEMAMVGDNILLVSQQTNSILVKLELNATTGRPISCARFLVGNFWSGLHGLAASKHYPGHVWASLQFRSLIILIDVLGSDLPRVVQRLPLESFSVNGPHCVCECGRDIWISCKDSSHVVRINHTTKVALTDVSVYPCSRRPIFTAIHPSSGDVYASLDLSSKIWRLTPSTGATTELDIPPALGRTPVGLVAGPDGNVWFTLLGNASGGNGSFARILPSGEFQWFRLTTPIAAKSGLIHLAFDREDHAGVFRFGLLSSSLIAQGSSIDAVFTVEIGSDGHVIVQHSIAFPTQNCGSHRVLWHRTGLFVSQLGTSSLAHVTGAAVLNPADVTGEATDLYDNFGLGAFHDEYVFSDEAADAATGGGPPVTKVLSSKPVAWPSKKTSTTETTTLK